MALSRRKTPSQRDLLRLLRYEAETGELFWNVREIDPNKDVAKQVAWNTRYGNTRAGSNHGEGYRTINLKTLGYIGLAHRVIWKMVYGTEPCEIDHINGNRADNRIENLRSISRKENTKNTRRKAKTKSIHHGVRWYGPRNKWVVGIGVSGRSLHIGYFESAQEAIAARKAAERKYGFHENHGKAA